ncbi:hypothetical protein CEXT_198411, partial [Caerostris extrusa]
VLRPLRRNVQKISEKPARKEASRKRRYHNKNTQFVQKRSFNSPQLQSG